MRSALALRTCSTTALQLQSALSFVLALKTGPIRIIVALAFRNSEPRMVLWFSVRGSCWSLHGATLCTAAQRGCLEAAGFWCDAFCGGAHLRADMICTWKAAAPRKIGFDFVEAEIVAPSASLLEEKPDTKLVRTFSMSSLLFA